MNDELGEKTAGLTVDASRAGERLDRVVAELAGIGSRAAAQKLIAAGRVNVAGRVRSKSYLVQEGDDVEVRVPPPPASELEAEEMDLTVPYEDEHLLVVDKPAGLVTHPGKGHDTGTLVHGLLGRIAGGVDRQRPGIVHRLDKDTSGLIIVARGEDAHRRLTEAMAAREIKRTYLALVYGHFASREGTIDAPVGRDASHRQRMAIDYGAGREAVTHYRVRESYRGAGELEGHDFSLLEVSLETGRTHQIRVHLAAIGHPVAGDQVYGRRRDVLEIGRQFLHSARLTFPHPVTGDTIDVSSPLPEDLEEALKKVSGFSNNVK